MAIFPRARGGSNTVRVGEPYQPDRLPFTRTFENLPLMEEIWRSPVDMVNILLFAWFYTSQVVFSPDFFESTVGPNCPQNGDEWYYPRKFNIALKSYLPRRKLIFQPSFFRGYVKLRGSIHWKLQGKVAGFVSGRVANSKWSTQEIDQRIPDAPCMDIFYHIPCIPFFEQNTELWEGWIFALGMLVGLMRWLKFLRLIVLDNLNKQVEWRKVRWFSSKLWLMGNPLYNQSPPFRFCHWRMWTL